MLITKAILSSDSSSLPAGGATPDEAAHVPPPGRGLGRGDLVDGHMFLSPACHLPKPAALRDRVRNMRSLTQ